MKSMLAAICIALLIPSLASAGMADKVERKRVADIDVIVYPTSIKDVVSIRGALPAGDAQAMANHDNAAVAQLTARMLDRGTEKEDKFAVARKLEGSGALLKFSARRQEVRIDGVFLRSDLTLIVGLLAEQLRTPAFTEAEFEKTKQEFVGELRSSMDDPQSRAYEAFSLGVFPVGHPNRETSFEEYIAAAEKLTVADVRAFYRRVYGPSHMTLVFVGDIDSASARKAVSAAFTGWKGGVDYLRDAPKLSAVEASEIKVELPAKSSSVVIIGQRSGLRSTDPDALPLAIGTAILGDGFTSRLMSSVRIKEGLTYGIYASVDDDTFVDGSWSVGASFAPELLERGLSSTRRETRLWWEKGVTDDELKARKTNLIGKYQIGLAKTGGVASNILSVVLSGRDMSWLDEYPKAVDAVTADQVNAAIKRHVDLEKMVLVEAGTLTPPVAK